MISPPTERLFETCKCSVFLCLVDNPMGHRVNTETNNKSYSCICMIYPGGTMRAE